jgi:hypothetical protein
MPSVVKDGTQYLLKADLRALATCLHSLAARPVDHPDFEPAEDRLLTCGAFGDDYVAAVVSFVRQSQPGRRRLRAGGSARALSTACGVQSW